MKIQINDAFINLVQDQFQYGGTKYANSAQKEVTDVLVETYGIGGLYWTIDKYVYRFKNLGRERDLLKIATYMYILWLKYGYHIAFYGTAHLNNTNVAQKGENFGLFLRELSAQIDKNASLNLSVGSFITSALLDETHDLLITNYQNPARDNLTRIFLLCMVVWQLSGFTGQDTDTGKPVQSEKK